MAVTDTTPPTTKTTHETEKLAASRWPIVGLWAGVALYFVLAQMVFVYTPDDAFITYRYSVNLAHGHGPVFNPSAVASERTEGFSCPLYMAIMALLYRLPLGLEMVFKAKFLGLACAIGTLIVAQKLAWRLRFPIWAVAVLPILLGAHSAFVTNSIDGMETALSTLLVTWATYLFLKEWQGREGGDKPGVPWSAVVFALAALNRPEALLIGLTALGVLIWGRKGVGRTTLVRWAMLFLVPVAAYFLFRRAYFGLWMPATYYAKAVPVEQGLEKGVAYLTRTFFYFIYGNQIYMALGGLWWLLVIGGASGERFRRAPGVLLPLIVVMQAVFVLRSGGDWMSGWRYMSAVVGIGVLLSVGGAVEIAEGLKRSSMKAFALPVAGAICAALFGVSLYGHRDYHIEPDARYNGCVPWASKGFTLDTRKLLDGWILQRAVGISDWLNANLKPGEIVAYTEMGVTPFLSPQLRFLDPNGLTDKGVATLPGAKHEQIGVVGDYTDADSTVGRYLRAVRKPDYVLRGYRARAGEEVPALPILGGDYTVFGTFPNPPTAPDCEGCLSSVHVWKRAIP